MKHWNLLRHTWIPNFAQQQKTCKLNLRPVSDEIWCNRINDGFFFFFVFYVVSGWSCVLSCLSPAVFYDFIFMRHNKFAYSISVQYFGLLLCLQVYVSVKKKLRNFPASPRSSRRHVTAKKVPTPRYIVFIQIKAIQPFAKSCQSTRANTRVGETFWRQKHIASKQ
jgi:hypothetical protein